MTDRHPHTLSGKPPRDPLQAAFDYEALEESAHTLGVLGRQLAEALARLNALDEVSESDAHRQDLLEAAAEKAWYFKIQRELCGFRDWHEVVKDYRIPGVVLARLGARPKGHAPRRGEG